MSPEIVSWVSITPITAIPSNACKNTLVLRDGNSDDYRDDCCNDDDSGDRHMVKYHDESPESNKNIMI